jgi:hypothetical protein
LGKSLHWLTLCHFFWFLHLVLGHFMLKSYPKSFEIDLEFCIWECITRFWKHLCIVLGNILLCFLASTIFRFRFDCLHTIFLNFISSIHSIMFFSSFGNDDLFLSNKWLFDHLFSLPHKSFGFCGCFWKGIRLQTKRLHLGILSFL